jgi:hypothetical protein
MKGWLIFFALAMSAGCTSAADHDCEKSIIPLVPGQVELRQGEIATAEDGSLSLRFLEVVADSRCPIGAQCIWAGNAEVALELTDDTGVRRIEINSFTEPRQHVAAGWSVTFVDLLPQPRSGTSIDPAERLLILDFELTAK